MEKIPQEQHGFNASHDARDPNVPQRTHDQSSAPDTRSHDELIAAVLAEHASPEQEAAALQAHIERESALLREALEPQVAQPHEQAPRVDRKQDGHHRHQRREESTTPHEQGQHQHGVEETDDSRGSAHKSQFASESYQPQQEQQEQQQQGSRYEAQPQQQQGEQESPAPAQPAVALDPVTLPTPPKPKRKAQTTGYGTNANIQVGHGVYLNIFTGNDDPVYQWLAAERQATEQRAMELRRTVRFWKEAAYQQLPQCSEGENGDTGRKCYVVPVEFFRFAEASAELVGIETHLRNLGVDPQRAGITQEVWDLFHEAVVDAQTDDEGDEEEDA